MRSAGPWADGSRGCGFGALTVGRQYWVFKYWATAARWVVRCWKPWGLGGIALVGCGAIAVGSAAAGFLFRLLMARDACPQPAPSDCARHVLGILDRLGPRQILPPQPATKILANIPTPALASGMTIAWP